MDLSIHGLTVFAYGLAGVSFSFGLMGAALVRKPAAWILAPLLPAAFVWLVRRMRRAGPGFAGAVEFAGYLLILAPLGLFAIDPGLACGALPAGVLHGGVLALVARRTLEIHRLEFGVPLSGIECIGGRRRSRPTTRSWPRRAAGALLWGLFGASCLTPPIVFVGILWAALGDEEPGAWARMGLPTIGASIAGMILLPKAARRRLAATARELRSGGWGAPILLLRSFADDAMAMAVTGRLAATRKATTFEETLTGQLWAYGPVIAIGRPGERAPPSGAAREYYAHEDWQAGAEAMIRESRWVAMLVGATEGLGWEIRRLESLDVLKRLILIVPPVSGDEVRRRWDRFVGQMEAGPARERLRELSVENVALVLLPEGQPVTVLTSVRRHTRAYEVCLAAALQLMDAAPAATLAS